MILTQEQILHIADNQKDLSEQQHRSKLLKMHVFGEDYVSFLERKANLETSDQVKLRCDHSISNSSLFSTLLRPVEKIFSADGGDSSFFTTKGQSDDVTVQMNEYLYVNNDFISVLQHTKDTWLNQLLTNPDGFCIVDYTTNVHNKNGFEYTPIDIDAIHDFKRRGVSGYEYVAIKESKTTNRFGKIQHAQYVTVIDDVAMYAVYQIGKNWGIAPFEEPIIIDGCKLQSFQHSFERCPAIAASNIVFKDNKSRQSPIWPEIELAAQYLEDNSTKTGFKFLHGYPIFWRLELNKCSFCNGGGRDAYGNVCNHCGGTGETKKDVSNYISIEANDELSESNVPVPNVAGYIAPPVETWKQMNEDLSSMRDEISFSHWGTVLAPIKNRTATGQVIDAEPITERLSKYTNSAEIYINTICDLIGGVEYGDSFVNSVVTLGAAYMLRSPSAIYEEYRNSLSTINNEQLLTQKLLSYYKHLYEKNPVAYQRKEKELSVEPYPHRSVFEVVNSTVSQKIKSRKEYFSEWNSTIPDSIYLTSNAAQLREMLDKYISDVFKIEE